MSRRNPPTSSGAPGRILIAVHDASGLHHSEPSTEAPIAALLGDPEATVWVDLIAPSPAQVEAVGHTLGLHALVVEDILEGNQRPKLEVTDGVIHIVLFAMSDGGRTVVNEVDIVLGLGFLLTVHGEAWDPRISHHLRGGLAPVMARGSDHLLWAICDDIVDGYFPFVDRVGETIDSIQDAVLAGATTDTLDALFLVKRELIEVRRSAGPTRDVFSQLTNRDLGLIDADEVIYFRDVYDHAIRLADELDNDRELAASTLDVYLTQVNNGLSVIMKRLTGVTVILAGIGAVAGVFGMSEAGTAINGGELGGFWAVTAVIVALAAGAALVLRRIDWI